jgi:DNA-binding NtrC family response regulator
VSGTSEKLSAPADACVLDDNTHEDRDREQTRPPGTIHECLYLVLEADRPLLGGARHSLSEIDEVVFARGRERTTVRERSGERNRLVVRFPGRFVSSIHARLRRGLDRWVLMDENSTNGTYLNGMRIESAAVSPDDIIEVGRAFFMIRGEAGPVDRPPSDLDAGEMTGLAPGFATLLPAMGRALEDLRQIAASNVSIVLSGETGTGKEVLARAIHLLSRRSGPVVAVNCSALTESLLESQLYGHVRGAFSGAIADAAGFVRSADQGTLLLDEVIDLERASQGALLRVLQEREVVPVGSARPVKVDVRFIATSPYPVKQVVGTGAFRADLAARLAGFSHRLPALRERRQDLGLLIMELLRKLGMSESDSLTLAPNFGLRLLSYDWPLNIRELEQTLARACVLAQNGVLDSEHFETGSADPEGSGKTDAAAPERVLSREDQVLYHRLVAELTQARGNVTHVARALGKAPMQIHRWMKRFGLSPAAFRGKTARQSEPDSE